MTSNFIYLSFSTLEIDTIILTQLDTPSLSQISPSLFTPHSDLIGKNKVVLKPPPPLP